MVDRTPIENKAARATYADAAKPDEDAAKLDAKAKARQHALAEGGYRLPDGFFAGEAAQIEKDRRIADSMPTIRESSSPGKKPSA